MIRLTALGTLAATMLAASAFLCDNVTAAPLSYNGGVYTQNFDGLPTNVSNPSQTIAGRGPHEFSSVTAASGLTGWQLANPLGSSTSTEFKSQDGSLAGSTGRGVVSFGTNGSSERALGLLPTSNQISTFGLVLQNDTATVLDSFTLSYVGEQWRRGGIDAPANSLIFAYGLASNIGGSLTNDPALNFASLKFGGEVAVDGNLPENQTLVSGTISGLNWAPGATLVLRWSIQDLTGQDNGLAVDNLTFRAAPVPEPSTVALLILGSVALCASGAKRIIRRRSN